MTDDNFALRSTIIELRTEIQRLRDENEDLRRDLDTALADALREEVVAEEYLAELDDVRAQLEQVRPARDTPATDAEQLPDADLCGHAEPRDTCQWPHTDQTITAELRSTIIELRTEIQRLRVDNEDLRQDLDIALADALRERDTAYEFMIQRNDAYDEINLLRWELTNG